MNKWLFALISFTSVLFSDEDCCVELANAACESSFKCEQGPREGWVSMRHREPGGIGYSQGYTSLDLFYAADLADRFYSFIDLRGHLFNHGKWASNAGIGLRGRPGCAPVIIGGNLYWDWREADHASFHQLSAGFEALWPLWDVRINGYAPVNRTKKGYRTGFEKFQGNQAIVYKKYELAMWGIDAALGYWLWRSASFGIHGALGGYYFSGDYGKNTGGGLLRADVHLTDWVTLKAQVSYDHLFQWNAQGEVAFNIPFGKRVRRGSKKIDSCSQLVALERRFVEQPERFEIIVTTNHKKTGRALHPVTGDPLTFFFVDNTSSSDGTFESPYSTLAQAQMASGPGDAIYVFPGNGTADGMNAGVILKNDQIFAGSGAPLIVQSRFGSIEIPQQTVTKPMISNNGVTVTIANRNIVSGLNIQSIADAAICDSVFTEGLSVFHCNITGDEGILLLDPFTGTFTVKDNQITGVTQEGIVFLQDFQGQFVAEANTITANTFAIAFALDCEGEFSAVKNHLNGGTGALAISQNFSGNCELQSNVFVGGAVPVSFIGTYNGRFLAADNQFISLNLDALGFVDRFTGVCILENNDILSAGTGVHFVGTFDGNFIATSNRIQTEDESCLHAGASVPFNGTAFIQNNTFIQTVGSTRPSLDMRSEIWDATIQNNVMSNPGAGLAMRLGHTGGAQDIAHIRLTDNLLSTPSAVNNGQLLNLSGIMEVESLDSTLNGLNQLNQGIITEVNVTFVPLD